MTEFQSADSVHQTRLQSARRASEDDPFGPIRYTDRGTKVVARIVIQWYDGEPTVEDFTSPTEARMRWETLDYLFKSRLTSHIEKVRLFKPVDGVFREVLE